MKRVLPGVFGGTDLRRCLAARNAVTARMRNRMSIAYWLALELSSDRWFHLQNKIERGLL